METISDANDAVLHHNIPNELMELRNTAMTAISIDAATTDKRRIAAIAATARILASEEDLRQFRDNPLYSEDTHRLASQLLTALTPKVYDFTPGIGIPWRKPTFRSLVLQLADKAVENGYVLLPKDHGNALVKDCIGYGKILSDGKQNGVNITWRGDQLIRCCLQIEDALRTENYSAKIGYTFWLKGTQLYFPYYNETAGDAAGTPHTS